MTEPQPTEDEIHQAVSDYLARLRAAPVEIPETFRFWDDDGYHEVSKERHVFAPWGD